MRLRRRQPIQWTRWDPPPPVEPLDDFEPVEVHVVDHDSGPQWMPPRPLREDADPRDSDRAPVVPQWVRSPVEALKAEAEWQWYRAKFHATRSPFYLGRAVRYSPGGAWRCLAGLVVWTRDDLGREGILVAQSAGNAVSAERQRIHHDHTVRNRAGLVVLAVSLVVSGGLVTPYLLVSAGGLAKPLGGLGLAVFVAAVLGKVGEPEDRPIVDAITTTETGRPRITDALLREAFDAAGLSKPPKLMADGTLQGGKEIVFVRNVARKGKVGTQTTIDLPIGKTAEDALRAKARIASGLSVTRMQVRITPDLESERRIDLYVHDFDPYATEPPVTPLAEVSKLSFWDGFPFGISAEGEQVRLSLLWTTLLVGAIPRMGKTWAARLVAAAAALDPHVRLIVFDGAGRGSWRPFERIAHRFGVGVRDEVFAHLIETLREVCEDIARRAQYLEHLDPDENPDSKITREIATNRALGMPLLLVIIDEIQQYLIDTKKVGGRKRGELVLELLTEIIKLGPAVGVVLVIATQKPGGDVIPTDFRDQIGTRFALRMTTSAGSKTILGDIPPGMDPVQFTKRHLGVGVLIGADDNDLADEGPQIVRTYMMDNHVLAGICERAYKLRHALGTLSGHAAGEITEERETDYLLEDVLEVARVDEDRLAPAVILERLVAVHPERYDGWTLTELRTRLRERYGISTSNQINRTTDEGERKNRRGIAVDEVRDALARQFNGAGV